MDPSVEIGRSPCEIGCWRWDECAEGKACREFLEYLATGKEIHSHSEPSATLYRKGFFGISIRDTTTVCGP